MTDSAFRARLEHMNARGLHRTVLLPLLAEEDWERVALAGNTAPHDPLHPSPTLPCFTQGREQKHRHALVRACLPQGTEHQQRCVLPFPRRLKEHA